MGRKVSIARLAALTSSGAPRVAMIVKSRTSPRRVWRLRGDHGLVDRALGWFGRKIRLDLGIVAAPAPECRTCCRKLTQK
jgi:hypothetical protein